MQATSASSDAHAPTRAAHPPSKATWLAIGSIAVGTFSMVTTEFLPIGLLTDIAAGLRITEGTAGLMVTIPGILAAFAGPALIVASGRLDRRAVMIALTALLVVSNALAAMAPNLATLLAARLLLGLCIGGFWTFAPGAATQLVPAPSQARAMSLVLMGVSVATVLGVPLSAFIGNLAGWRAAFAANGLLAAAVLAAQIWLLPAMPPARAIKARDLLTPLTRPLARIGLLVTLLLIAGHFAAYTYLRPLLEQVFGLSPHWVSTLLLVYGAAGFIGTFIGGSIVARSARLAAVVTGVLIATALLLSTLIGGGIVGGATVVVLWGVAFGLVPVALTGWMLNAVPDVQEAGQALLVSGFQVAIAAGSLLGGITVDGHGIARTMLVASFLAAAAAVAAATLGRARPQAVAA